MNFTKNRSKVEGREAFHNKSFEPIAIVGMSCRFPDAGNLQQFWQLLADGRDTIKEIPNERWNFDEYYDADSAASDKTHQRHGSFLPKVNDFDPFFFNISPAEAAEMNPSQKLMLELAWEAMESSSIPHNKIEGKRVGVYFGNIWSDFEHYRKHKNAVVTTHSAVGQSANIIANRVSYTFGFTGPSLVVDTGCSSSLVALHLACQSLWDGSTDYCMAGGINHILDPDQYILLTKFGGLSKNGRCSTFDINADGFVRGEGAGNLMLKRLSDAERDGDKIYAVIKGTAMNNNGFNASLPATSVNGQKQVLADAYKHSGINPSDIHYVEAHGTGTKLGDPTESRALGEFFGENRKGKLHVGSVKTNLGHLEGAAGIAGLIKVVLAMKNRKLPKSLNYSTPNPDIPFEELKLQVQDKLSGWPAAKGELLRAGINSFGWGGTNAHTVIEEYKKKEKSKGDPKPDGRILLPLSAKSEKSLRAYALAYKNSLEGDKTDTTKQIAVTTSLLKKPLEYKKCFNALDKAELLEMLGDFSNEDAGLEASKPYNEENKLAFIFPGQGSQWLGMGKELYAKEEVFKKTIESCEKAFQKYTKGWSLLEQLHASEEESRLDEIDIIQPCISAMQISLARLWESWGIKADTVVGHSMGEVAAAHISGAISLDEAAKIICTRSQLMKTVSGTGGAMAVTELTLDQAKVWVDENPGISIAVNNSHKSTVLAGDAGILDGVLGQLEEKGLFARRVKVDVASHSVQMDPLKEGLSNALQSLKPIGCTVKLYSTARDIEMRGEDMGADYWVDNLRNSVKFASVVDKLIEDKHTVFIEVSPHPVLTTAVSECLEYKSAQGSVIPSLFRGKDELKSITGNLAELYNNGYPVNWSEFHKVQNIPHVDLPGYPFQRETFEIEERVNIGNLKKPSHPLLGNKLSLAGAGQDFFWENVINIGSLPYLKGHQVNEQPVLPGCAYFEMILTATYKMFGRGNHIIKDLQFKSPVVLDEGSNVELQAKMGARDEGNITLEFYSRNLGGDREEGWTLTAEASVELNAREKSKTAEKPLDFGQFESSQKLVGVDYYKALTNLGLGYEGHFQGVQHIKKEGSYVLARVEVAESLLETGSPYIMHPAFLDSCFQTIFANMVVDTEAEESLKTTFLSSIEGFEILDKGSFKEGAWVLGNLKQSMDINNPSTLNLVGDLWICDDAKVPLIKVTGVEGKVIDSQVIEDAENMVNDWVYSVDWLKKEDKTAKGFINKEKDGAWLIIGEESSEGHEVYRKLTNAGFDVTFVKNGTDYCIEKEEIAGITGDVYHLDFTKAGAFSRLIIDLLEKKNGRLSGIIHIGSINSTPINYDLDADKIESNQVKGSLSLLNLVKGFHELKLSTSPQLFIVTNGVQCVGTDIKMTQINHAPMWGLGKVIANELPQFDCKRIDLSFNPGEKEMELLLEEVFIGSESESEVVIRGAERFVPRLSKGSPNGLANDPIKFNGEGTYLVTGYRGLGFKYIQWMIENGAKHFALLSRSGSLTEGNKALMQKYGEQGVKFLVHPVDVSDFKQLQSAIERIATEMPPIKGVIHAAGLIEASPLYDIENEKYLSILAPKVKGTWNLHLVTAGMDLECFTVFSSASTMIGLSGQGSYVAANYFLDHFAHYRRQLGLPANSINWGVIKDVGMVANEEELEKYARAEGFEPVMMEDAINVLDKVYNQNYPQIGIMKLHPEQTVQYYPVLGKSAYFKSLIEEGVGNAKEDKKALLGLVRDAEGKEAKITLLEQFLTKMVSKITKAPISRISSSMTFKGLGLDSLMAVQLRNILEKACEIKLSVTNFWEYPSINEYAIFMYMKLGLEEGLVIANEGPKDWFVVPEPNESAVLKLFCFHDAGGSSDLYPVWKDHLDHNIELNIIELPGRGRRSSEKPYTHIGQLVKDLQPVILDRAEGKPFAFFGHSMGGLLAFEIARALEKSGKQMPLKLYVSSTPQLSSYDKRDVDHTMPDQELVKAFPHISEKAVADEELRKVLIKMLKADLRLISSYRYKKESPLPLSITAIRGMQDPRVSESDMEKWEGETSMSFSMFQRPGGHRYITGDTQFLMGLLNKDLPSLVMPEGVKVAG